MSRGSVFDLAGKARIIEQLTAESAAEGFWDDPQTAQRAMQRLTTLQTQVSAWEEIGREIGDATEMAELAQDDPGIAAELHAEVEQLRARLDQMEFDLMLSGPHDAANAILAIHAGAGGTESQDWAEMLLRMYLRWAESRGFGNEIVDMTEGEEAGIKSATIELKGEYAYGYAKAERGVHRLVRISPYDASKRRHTSFALVEVLPEVEDDTEIVINDDDIRVDTYRSSGAGGQHVNKTSSAIRITHLPTGIVVTCQNERSQTQNRETAMKILRARLAEKREQERAAEQQELKGEHIAAGWGNAIRSYVLHPYNLVKDTRSGYETSNTQAVLNGEIDEFMNAYLRWHMGDAPAAAEEVLRLSPES
jgi:peptide chain release factor 2